MRLAYHVPFLVRIDALQDSFHNPQYVSRGSCRAAKAKQGEFTHSIGCIVLDIHLKCSLLGRPFKTAAPKVFNMKLILLSP
jgi:hypothetical protein